MKIFKKIIPPFLIFFLMVNADAREDLRHPMYLMVGSGISANDGVFGPALITEFGYGIRENLFFVPRLTITTNVTDNENIYYTRPPGKPHDFNSYYDLSLRIKYQLSGIERLELGLGASAQFKLRVYLREYNYYDKIERTINGSLAYTSGIVGSVDYAVFQKGNIDLGIDGMARIGKFSLYMVALYLKFGS